MNWHHVFTGLAFVALSTLAAPAATIIRYDTEGIGPGTPTATQVNAINPGTGVTGINVTRGAGLTPVSAAFSINSSGWNDLSANDYYQFGFTTTTVYDVETFTLGLRSSNTGPGFVNLLYAKDGGAFTVLASINPIELVGIDFNNLTIDLSEIGLVNSSLIFRLVVDPANPTNALFNEDPTANPAIGSAGTFRFASFSPSANVFLNPEIMGSVIPEPSSILLAGMGLVPLLCARLLRRRSCPGVIESTP